MPRLQNSPVRIQLGLRGWAAIATALAILIAVIVAITFLAIGLFVFVLPAMLLAPLVYYFMPKPKPVRPVSDTAERELNRPTTIDGTFRVTDMTPPENKSGANGEL
jgi:fatty acid desaturase